MFRQLRAAVVAVLLGGTALAQAAPVPEIDYAVWTSVDASTSVATGTIGSLSVTLSGGTLSGFFSADGVEARGLLDAPTYTLSFSAAVTDPVLRLTSLASTLTFAPGTVLSILENDGNLTLLDNQLSGVAIGASDANGIVQLDGTFSSFSFSAAFSGGGGDGFLVLPGIVPGNSTPTTPVPEPASAAMVLLGMGVLRLMRRQRAS